MHRRISPKPPPSRPEDKWDRRLDRIGDALERIATVMEKIPAPGGTDAAEAAALAKEIDAVSGELGGAAKPSP